MAEERTEEKPPKEDAAVTGTESTEAAKQRPKKHGEEVGGPKGLEPTRYGDWERKGRCIDF